MAVVVVVVVAVVVIWSDDCDGVLDRDGDPGAVDELSLAPEFARLSRNVLSPVVMVMVMSI